MPDFAGNKGRIWVIKYGTLPEKGTYRQVEVGNKYLQDGRIMGHCLL